MWLSMSKAATISNQKRYAGRIPRPAFHISLALFFASSLLFAQSPALLDTRVSLSSTSLSPAAALKEITDQVDFKISYSNKILKTAPVQFPTTALSLTEALDRIFEDQEVLYLEKGGKLLLVPATQNRKQVVIGGYITDATSGAALSGVSVYCEELKRGTASNRSGHYSLVMPPGRHTIAWSYMGYGTQTLTLDLAADTLLSISLEETAMELEGVEIEDDEIDQGGQAVAPGLVRIPVEQLAGVPSLLGETDILKAFQTVPGVKMGTEGSGGLYVRGGGIGQNLILFDGAPVYNPYHLFGFFSVFQEDMVKSADLYKGDFPVRYGGRLSSVVDVTTRSGSMDKWRGKVSVGTISSSFSVEAPIKKDKASILLTGRRTYADLFIRPFWKDETFMYHFYDLGMNTKINLGDKDRLTISGYFGRDKMFLADEGGKLLMGMDWGNTTVSANWDHVFTPNVFGKGTIWMSNYRSDTGYEFKSNALINDDPFNRGPMLGILDWQTLHNYDSTGQSLKEMTVRTALTGTGMKYDIEVSPNHKISLNAGVQVSRQFVRPVSLFEKYETNTRITDGFQRMVNWDNGYYISASWRPVKALHINPGFRMAHLGYGKYQKLFPEPRFLAEWTFPGHWKASASYTRMDQFLHLLSQSGGQFPTDLWVGATDQIRPQQAHQVALGVTKSNLPWRMEASLQGYYKTMKDVTMLMPGAFTIEWNYLPGVKRLQLEDELIFGQGEAYGAEFLAQKKEGRLTGWLGYTLSWSTRQFEDINSGSDFFSKYDSRHDVNISGAWTLKPGVSFSAGWMFATGRMFSLYTGQYYSIPSVSDDGPTIGYNEGASINGNTDGTFMVTDYLYNNFRGEPYHRLDLAVRLSKKKKRGTRTWSFGVYNAYSRPNPFMYEYVRAYSTRDGKYVPSGLYRYGLFPVVPSVNYSFKF